jgi:hypothetical protein
MDDAAFIQSNEDGVECISITPLASTQEEQDCEIQQHVVDPKILTAEPNIGFVLLPRRFSHYVGITCNSHYAWFCSVDYPLAQHHIRFESHVNRIAMVYPYLVAFSWSVIEIRHLETVSDIKS